MTNETTQRLNCGHCNIETDMPMIAWAEREVPFAKNLGYAERECLHWQMFLCPSCKKPTLVQHHTNTLWDEPGRRFAETQILYPQLSTIERYLPEKVRGEFVSALKLKQADANAFSVMVRRTIERICHDKQAVGRSLYEQLKDLPSKNLIPETISSAANNIRLLGNVGAHSSKGNVSQGEAEVLFALLNSVIEYLYIAPALIAELEKNLSKAPD